VGAFLLENDMQYQLMPFGWPMPDYLPLPPIIDDRDLFINSIVNGTPGPEGPAGPQGEQGPQGEPGVGIVDAEITDNPGDLLLLLSDGSVVNAGQVTGPPGPPGPSGANSCSVVTITSNYTAQQTDCYIGAQLTDASTLILPKLVVPGTCYSIKLEFGAPVGNRKLVVQPEPPGLINGVTNLTLTTPYQSITVVYNNNNWWTI
jgi:hypothetical protein